MSQHPLAVVDRDGCVWPWDGQEENPHLIGAGSRYLFTQREVDTCKAAYQASLDAQRAKRQGDTFNPTAAPAKRKSVGTAKKVREAVMGTGAPGPVYVSE